MQRIGVEADSRKQDKAQQSEQGKHDEQRRAAAPDRVVQWRRPVEADFGTLAVRAKEAYRGGQESHRAEERDQHADAGDQPQLRHTTKIGRHKSEKACRRRGRGHQDLPADAAPGLCQSPRRLGKQQTHLAIAHRELDREVHRDADEEDAEADRNQVQGPDRGGGEQQGQHQAEPQRHQDRGDQPP